MSAQDIRDRYKVPAALNMRIKFRGAAGTIAGFEGPRLLVMMDGEKSLTRVHPVLGVTYPSPGEVFPPRPKSAGWGLSHLSLVPGEDEDEKPREPRKTGKRGRPYATAPEPLADGDPRHGTVDGYRRFKCKCQPCKDAWNAHCREARAARHAMKLDPDDRRHGTSNFYSNYGCRCRPCTEAQLDCDPRVKGRGVRGTRPKARRPRTEGARAELQAAHSVSALHEQEIAS